MATGTPVALRRWQVSSHWVSCGQTRPQTAGRLLASRTLAAAAANSPFSTSLTNVGMSMRTGQPAMQPGLAQSRHRRASATASSAESPRLTSAKSVAALRGRALGHGPAGDLDPLLDRDGPAELLAPVLLELGQDLGRERGADLVLFAHGNRSSSQAQRDRISSSK